MNYSSSFENDPNYQKYWNQSLQRWSYKKKTVQQSIGSINVNKPELQKNNLSSQNKQIKTASWYKKNGYIQRWDNQYHVYQWIKLQANSNTSSNKYQVMPFEYMAAKKKRQETRLKLQGLERVLNEETGKQQWVTSEQKKESPSLSLHFLQSTQRVSKDTQKINLTESSKIQQLNKKYTGKTEDGNKKIKQLTQQNESLKAKCFILAKEVEKYRKRDEQQNNAFLSEKVDYSIQLQDFPMQTIQQYEQNEQIQSKMRSQSKIQELQIENKQLKQTSNTYKSKILKYSKQKKVFQEQIRQLELLLEETKKNENNHKNNKLVTNSFNIKLQPFKLTQQPQNPQRDVIQNQSSFIVKNKRQIKENQSQISCASDQSQWGNYYDQIPSIIYSQVQKILTSKNDIKIIGESFLISSNNQNILKQSQLSQIQMKKLFFGISSTKLTEQNEKLKAQKDKFQKSFEDAQKQLQQMEIQYIRLKEQTKKDSTAMKSKQILLTQLNSKLKSELVQLQTQISKLKSQIKETLEDSELLRVKVISEYEIKSKYFAIKELSFTQKIKELEQQVKSDQNLIDKCQRQMRKLQKQNNEQLKQLRMKLNQNFKTAQRRADQMRFLVKNKDIIIQSLEESVNELKMKNELLTIQKQETMRKSQQQTRFLQQQINNVNRKLKKVIDKCEVQQIQLNEKIQTLHGIIQNNKLQIAQLSQSLKTKQSNIFELQNKAKNQTGSVNQLLKILNNMK